VAALSVLSFIGSLFTKEKHKRNKEIENIFLRIACCIFLKMIAKVKKNIGSN
jgi:hypothetical protein